VFGLGSVAYWMDASRFLVNAKSVFFPGNYITMASQVGAIYLKMSRHVLRIQWYLRCLPSSLHSEVMVTRTELKGQNFLESVFKKSYYNRGMLHKRCPQNQSIAYRGCDSLFQITHKIASASHNCKKCFLLYGSQSQLW